MNSLVKGVLSALAVVKDDDVKDCSLILNKKEQIALRDYIDDIITENADLKWELDCLKKKIKS